jgi:hypothetical protein
MIGKFDAMLGFYILFSQHYLTVHRAEPYVNCYLTHTDNYLMTNDNVFNINETLEKVFIIPDETKNQ